MDGGDGGFDWDESQQINSIPLKDLSLTERELIREGPESSTSKLEHPVPDLADWCNGKSTSYKPTGRYDNFGKKQAREISFRSPGFDHGKSYVARYKEEMEKTIAQISLRPREQSGNSAVGNHACRSSRNGSMSLVGTAAYAPRMMDPDPVYASFKMDIRNKAQESLAVFDFKHKILSGLRSHQVMIVEGFTGSGKTTQIPQYILDDLASTAKCGNIVVTQPRRIAAQSVAERVCKERGWAIGDLVGYQVGLNRKTSEKTRLTYVTTGVLLQTLISKKMLSDYSHIIVDEVHERDLDTDLLILVIKKLIVETGDRNTKIILMSATLNAAKFADYFPKWKCGATVEESIIIQIPQTTFHKVHEYYIDNLDAAFGKEFAYQNTKASSDVSEDPKLHSYMYETTINILQALNKFETDMATSSNKPRSVGGVLAFLPGLMEIDTLYKKCIEEVDKQINMNNEGLRWTLIPLHSSITTEEQQKVFHPAKPGYRKIILATNIAESSITVTDITYGNYLGSLLPKW